MTASRRQRSSRPAPSRELTELRLRLAEAEEALSAIRTGEVDAVVITGERGARVFTLEGAERAYRVLMESMNEGALTLAPDTTILYANRCFARMVNCPLERVIGSSFGRFLSREHRATLRPLLKRTGKSGSKVQVLLNAGDGSRMPAQVSIRSLEKSGVDRATVGMVVTDMTEARRNEEMLRKLSQRLVQAQEAERSRVALELHDHITQMLCAILFRSQALADGLSARDKPMRKEAMKLRQMVGKTAEEVERVSRNLRPSVLDEMGLVAVLRATAAEFAKRTSVSVKLSCVRLAARLPADIEVTLWRILQETLSNVERHAHARHVSVRLTKRDVVVQLVIRDDGIGLDAETGPVGREGKGGIGLLSMRERTTFVGGTFQIRSTRSAGTEVQVRIPLPPGATAAGRPG